MLDNQLVVDCFVFTLLRNRVVAVLGVIVLLCMFDQTLNAM